MEWYWWMPLFWLIVNLFCISIITCNSLSKYDRDVLQCRSRGKIPDVVHPFDKLSYVDSSTIILLPGFVLFWCIFGPIFLLDEGSLTKPDSYTNPYFVGFWKSIAYVVPVMCLGLLWLV